MLCMMICLHTLFVALVGSVPFRSGKSCQDIIQRGDSTGNGEYWVNPQGNGNPFKTFCDMSTAGGTVAFSVSN